MQVVESIFRGGIAIAFLVAICYAFSKDRSRINWKIILYGILFQFILAICVLKIPLINRLFDGIAHAFTRVLKVSEAGAKFMFGSLVTNLDSFGYIFAFQVLPTIVFFSALTSILYYFGILQKVVKVMAWAMAKTLRLSGPEALAASANIFIGQTEAPLVVKPYLENMSRSEIMCLMTGGMATIAGGVFAAYVGYLGGTDEALKLFYAKHLLTASLISAPAAIVAAKILVPETEKDTSEIDLKMEKTSNHNVLDAISKGTTDGLKLAVNVAVMLVVFTALIALANKTLLFLSPTALDNWVSDQTNGRYQGFNFTYILGVIFAPIAWLLGTPSQDVLLVGQLLGQKTMINEFVAYAELDNMRQSGIVIQEKSLLISTYALCGFANFASIGIQIGGIGSLVPSKRKQLTELGFLSLLGGTVACFLTAAVAGILWVI